MKKINVFENNSVIIEEDNKRNIFEVFFKPNKNGEIVKRIYNKLMENTK